MNQNARPKLLLAAFALLVSGCHQTSNTVSTAHSIYRPASSVIALDGKPYKIVQHKGRLYVISFHDRKLWVLDAATGIELYKFSQFDPYHNTVDKLDENGKVIGERTLQGMSSPSDIAIVGNKLFIYQSFSDLLLVFDAETVHPIARIKVGDNGEMAASPDGKRLYYASTNDLTIIDIENYEKTTINYPKGSRGIGAMAVSSDGNKIYMGIQRGSREAKATAPSPTAGPVNPFDQTHPGSFLAVYDLVNLRYIAIRSIGDTLLAQDDDASISRAMAFSDDGRTLYIAMSQCMAGIHVFDTKTLELRAPITFASMNKYFPWPGCNDIAVHHDSIDVIVGSNHELVRLDPKTHQIRQVISLRGYQGNSPTHMASSPDRIFICHPSLRRLIVVDR